MTPEQVRNIAQDLRHCTGAFINSIGLEVSRDKLYEILMGTADLWEAATDATHLHTTRGEVYDCKTCQALLTLEKLKP